jgi:hypothetical protein
MSDGLKWSSKGVKFTYNWWGTIQSLPQMYYSQVTAVVQAAREEYGALDVEGGSGNGGWLLPHTTRTMDPWNSLRLSFTIQLWIRKQRRNVEIWLGA